jgi:uncharacterized BrkB/YihY/UPF0761 family membrane protein
MNTLASFAPILMLSVGSLAYLLGGHIIERLRMAAVFAGVLIVGAGLLAAGLQDNAASAHYGVVVSGSCVRGSGDKRARHGALA